MWLRDDKKSVYMHSAFFIQFAVTLRRVSLFRDKPIWWIFGRRFVQIRNSHFSGFCSPRELVVFVHAHEVNAPIRLICLTAHCFHFRKKYKLQHTTYSRRLHKLLDRSKQRNNLSTNIKLSHALLLYSYGQPWRQNRSIGKHFHLKILSFKQYWLSAKGI